jgi:hypothetical protein
MPVWAVPELLVHKPLSVHHKYDSTERFARQFYTAKTRMCSVLSKED